MLLKRDICLPEVVELLANNAGEGGSDLNNNGVDTHLGISDVQRISHAQRIKQCHRDTLRIICLQFLFPSFSCLVTIDPGRGLSVMPAVHKSISSGEL